MIGSDKSKEILTKILQIYPFIDKNKNNNHFNSPILGELFQPMKHQLEEKEESTTKKQKPTTKTLQDYFDIPKYETVAEYSKHFEEFADYLLNKTVLSISGENFRFAELEFYYTNDVHYDPFTHGSDLQKLPAKWYFHTMPNGTYKGTTKKKLTFPKGGSFKGLDITIGRNDGYGGILVRGIQNLKTKELTDGPSLCVDKIVELNKMDKIDTLAKEMKEKHDLSVMNEEPFLSIKDSTILSPLAVHRSARVGLTLKQKDHKEKRLQYLLKFYRFFSFPQEIKKGKNYMVLAAHHLGKTPGEIANVFKSTKKSIENFISLYEKAGKAEDYFGAKMNNDDLAILHGALKEHLL